MIALIQRVSSASVTIEGVVKSSIRAGLLVLLGIEEADGPEDVAWLSAKVANLRIFPDADGVMNVSLKDLLVQNPPPRGGGGEERAGGGVPSIMRPRPLSSWNSDFPLPEEGDLKGAIVVSQFTLHASTKKGNRPSYIKAARPEHAEPLYQSFVQALSAELQTEVRTGEFGADMQVALVNDGPVTIHIDSKNRV